MKLRKKKKGRKADVTEEEILEQQEQPEAEQEEQAADEQAEAAGDTDAPQEPEEELTPEQKLEAELADQKDKYLRLMAEYDNFRKRSAKERLELTDNVKASAVSEILPLSKAQEYLSRGLAPHIDAHVSETALRYVCIQQKDIKNRVYRPMWCFLLQEYPDGADLKRPFKRRTALVDAIDGTVWYYDPDAYQLYKTELE